MAIRSDNSFPHPDSISDTMSPANIVTGTPKPDFNTLSLEFGTYVQVYNGTSNDTKSRTLGAIATNPTGNSNGDHFFMSLETGKRIHRRSWTILPISDATISRVEALAEHEGMPLVDSDNSIDEYDPDEIIDESAYDKSYQPPVSDPAYDHNLTTDAYTTESELDPDPDDDIFDDNGHNDDFDSAPTPIANEAQNATRAPTTTPPLPATDNQPTAMTTAVAPHENEEREQALFNPPTAAVAPKNEERGQPTPNAALLSTLRKKRNKRKSLHNKSGRADYTYCFSFTQISHSLATAASTLEPSSHDDLSSMPAFQKAIYGLLFTQMTAQKGIKKHGQAAFDALRKEFEQFRVMDVFEPLTLSSSPTSKKLNPSAP
jgi:hypothetical protein